MPSARPNAKRRFRWLVSAALLAAAPKCLACVLGYLGLGAALGLAGPELCGAPVEARDHASLLLLATGLVAAAAFFILRRKSA